MFTRKILRLSSVADTFSEGNAYLYANSTTELTRKASC